MLGQLNGGDPMELANLEHSEQLALVGLARLMIRLDGSFSEEERELIDAIVEELGETRYEALAEEAAEKMQDEEAVKYYARHVQRAEARELIFGVLYDLAVPESIDPAESSLLDWLTEAWALDGEALGAETPDEE